MNSEDYEFEFIKTANRIRKQEADLSVLLKDKTEKERATGELCYRLGQAHALERMK